MVHNMFKLELDSNIGMVDFCCKSLSLMVLDIFFLFIMTLHHVLNRYIFEVT